MTERPVFEPTIFVVSDHNDDLIIYNALEDATADWCDVPVAEYKLVRELEIKTSTTVSELKDETWVHTNG